MSNTFSASLEYRHADNTDTILFMSIQWPPLGLHVPGSLEVNVCLDQNVVLIL